MPTLPLTPAPPAHVDAAIVLAVATLAYLVYHLATSPALVTRLFPDATRTPDALMTRTAWFRKLLGAVLFTAVPVVLAAALGLDLGLSLQRLETSLLWTAVPFAVLLPLLWRQSRQPSFQAHYPEVRTPFTARTRLANALAWLAYLVGYELFFRGLLVLGLASLIGPLPALATSVMGYVFVHLHKYPGEAVGSVVSGVGFAVVALHTGSLLMPIALHVLLALTTDELTARARAANARPA